MNRLKLLRTRARITLRDLEKYVNIRNATLSQIENGKQPFREIHVKKLTSFFDVTSDYLLGYSSRGIGIYFANEDHAMISNSELEKIAEEHTVVEEVIRVNPSEWVINTGVEQTSLYRNEYIILRSVDINKENAHISKSVMEQVINELNHLDTRDLEKVLKFINDYIK